MPGRHQLTWLLRIAAIVLACIRIFGLSLAGGADSLVALLPSMALVGLVIVSGRSRPPSIRVRMILCASVVAPVAYETFVYDANWAAWVFAFLQAATAIALAVPRTSTGAR